MQPFSFAYYKHMLETTLQAGYRITSFENYDPTHSKTVILRHDIDYTLDGLIDFAKIEAALNISASYLFRIHSDEYNLFACVTWKAIEDIIKLGHNVGLHFEAMNVGRALDIDPFELLLREKQIIEKILGFEIYTCSEHREISGVVHNTPLFHDVYDPKKAGFQYYAMDEVYCKKMRYLSDSNANWRDGDLLTNLDKYNRFQVLVHPDWWFEHDLLLKGPYYHSRRIDI